MLEVIFKHAFYIEKYRRFLVNHSSNTILLEITIK